LKAWCLHRSRQASMDADTIRDVMAIKAAVVDRGDAAVCDYTAQFDGVVVAPSALRVTPEQVAAAYKQVSESVVDALRRAAANIQAYHRHQIPRNWHYSEEGRCYGAQFNAIDAVGLYVPGGRAAYPTSVLMTAIPAIIAGCSRVVMVSPPTQGAINPTVLVAADIAGVSEIYSIGGAQAIIALAYGTDTIPAVDKIVGPGNRYVTAAKQLVYGVVDIDKPAGPSEVCVYVDTPAYAAYAAAEMWAQLEHDPDASAVAITTSPQIAEAIQIAAADQQTVLTRQTILRQSAANAVIAVVDNHEDSIAAINQCASEHVVLLTDTAEYMRTLVRHGGSLFCGPYTPVTLGDYYAGPNHVLPTARSARFASPLGVMDFMKYSSYLETTQAWLADVATDIAHLTQAEGFDAHYQAVAIRLQ
jgi:histidinol dehydrogenase